MEGCRGIWVAVASLAAFACFITYLLKKTPNTTPDLEWTRAVYLLSGVVVIVFAAAGFLFGKEVHRTRADEAAKRADTAESNRREAENSKTAAMTNGKNLVALIEAKRQKAERLLGAPMAAVEAAGPAGAVNATIADLKELQQVAQTMFP